MSRAFVLLLVGVGAVAGHPALGQQGVLAGAVTSDSLGKHQLVGAEVSIPALQLTTHANFGGDYRFEGLAAGRYLVIAVAAGYRTVGDSVTVAASGETFHDFVLFTRANVLDSVVATATAAPRKYSSPLLQGFEQRRAEGLGHFIPEEELRRHEGEKLSNLLRARIAGIQFVYVHGANYATAGHTAKNGQRVLDNVTTISTSEGVFPMYCYVTIYLDGALTYDYSQTMEAITKPPPPKGSRPDNTLATPPPRVDEYNIDRLAGVEFYAGEAALPLGLRSGSGCGVLALWTRER